MRSAMDSLWDLYWIIKIVPEKRVLWTWERMMLKTFEAGREMLWFINWNTIKN